MPKRPTPKRRRTKQGPRPSAPRKKAAPKRKVQKRRTSQNPKIRWRGARADVFGGGVHHYSVETLARGIETLIDQRDILIAPSFRSMIGEAPVGAMTFTPIGSDRASYRIKVTVANAKKRESNAVLVVARRDGDLSKQLERDYGHMQFCQVNAPKAVCNVYRSGLLFIPRLREGAKGGRKVFAYMEAWLGAASAIEMTPSGQLRLIGDKGRLLSQAQSEGVRMRMFETALRIYDEKTGSGLAMRKTGPDCWAATGRSQDTPNITLMRCPGIMRRCTPARYLNAAIQYRWPGPKGDVPVGPLDADSVVRAATRAWGKPMAMEALTAYAHAVRKDRYPQPSAGLLPLLER